MSETNNTINNLDMYGVDADKVILKRALLELKGDVLDGKVKSQYLGICGNLDYKIGKHDHICSYKFVKENCRDWIMFSGGGDEDYPVPNSKETAVKNESCWDTPEKVNYRLSLIEHLLTKFS